MQRKFLYSTKNDNTIRIILIERLKGKDKVRDRVLSIFSSGFRIRIQGLKKRSKMLTHKIILLFTEHCIFHFTSFDEKIL